MAQDPVGTFLKAFLIPGTQQSVQQDVIRLESGIRLELAAPVPILVLLGKQKLPCSGDCRAHALAQFLNFSKSQFWT
jgi:hypothetical protein